MVSYRGALSAPFVFAALALAAAGSVVASPSLWFASLLCIAFAAAPQPSRPWLGLSPIAIVLGGYATWVIVNVLLNDPYTPAGLFHPLFLVGGFLLGRNREPRARATTMTTLTIGAIVLAMWALWQAASGEGRGHALFETPNTLATLLNLVLAPLLFRLAYAEGGRRRAATLALLLAAALVVTLSRGGLIALIGGILAATLLFGERPRRAGVARLLIAVAIGTAIGLFTLSLAQWRHAPGEGELSQLASTLASSAGSRGELYRLALADLGNHPWLGTGYLGFRALLEARRAEVPSYADENITYFVHDDYLQTLMESGVPGALLLLAVIVVPFWQAKKGAGETKERVELFASLAGLATMAIHALGDFPFYVPVCLLVFGTLLGEVDARLASRDAATVAARGPAARWAALAGVALLGAVLVPPPLAEAAAWYGERSWREAKSEEAAYGFELARRLQPRDWRYHWYAGQFWYAQAAAGNRRAANLSDHAFAAAVATNPHEPRPLLWRLEAQIRFAAFLDQPQPPATLRQWADQALALAPRNPAVRRDYTAAVEQLERH